MSNRLRILIVLTLLGSLIILVFYVASPTSSMNNSTNSSASASNPALDADAFAPRVATPVQPRIGIKVGIDVISKSDGQRHATTLMEDVVHWAPLGTGGVLLQGVPIVGLRLSEQQQAELREHVFNKQRCLILLTEEGLREFLQGRDLSEILLSGAHHTAIQRESRDNALRVCVIECEAVPVFESFDLEPLFE